MKWSLLLWLGLATMATTAAAAPPTYPLSSVRRGQIGVGYTTFAGNTPEKFPFEVVSVVTNFLPGMDIILVKSDDPRFAVSGFWQGMSGSPLYLDGKVACAFSYGFRFNKVALGGCTPIQYMIDEGFGAKPRGPSPSRGRAVPVAEWRRLTPASGPAPLSEWTAANRVIASAAAAPTVDGQSVRASVPLAVSGLSDRAFAELAGAFAGTGLEPMRAGTASGAFAAPDALVMGGSIAVILARGDVSISGTGTVSYIDGKRVLAFGHPMFQEGELYVPVATAHVHTVIPSAQMSYVMASAGKEVGSLVQDRQSMIMADLGMRAKMIPVEITLAVRGGATHTVKAEVVNNKWLTTQMVVAIARSAIDLYAPDRDVATGRIEGTVALKGYGAISFADAGFAPDGLANALGAIRIVRVLSPLLQNPYGPVEIEGVSMRIEVGYDVDFGIIRGVSLTEPALRPGQRNFVNVKLETYDGAPRMERVPVDVPAHLAGSIVQLEVSSGESAKPDAPPANDVPSMLEMFRKLLPGTVWAVSLYPAGEGASVDGALIADLPPSAADRLRPASRVQRAEPYRPVIRTITPTATSLQGTASLLVRIGKQ